MKKSRPTYTLCEVKGTGTRRHAKASKSLKPFPVTAQRFAAARAGCFMTISQTAELMSGHRSINTVLGYFQSSSATTNPAAKLLSNK
jgi:hypothetical protein